MVIMELRVTHLKLLHTLLSMCSSPKAKEMAKVVKSSVAITTSRRYSGTILTKLNQLIYTICCIIIIIAIPICGTVDLQASITI